MNTRVHVNEKIKVYVQKKAALKGLTEGEIIELELFGVISKKKR